MSRYENRRYGNGDDRPSHLNRRGNPLLKDRDSHQKHHSRGSGNERSKSRQWDQDGRKSPDRQHRARIDRSLGDERRRDKHHEYDHNERRDHGRHHDYGRERERKNRHHSPPISRDRGGKRSRSQSPSISPSKSKRTTGFDMVPPVVPTLPGVPTPDNVGLLVPPSYPLARPL